MIPARLLDGSSFKALHTACLDRYGTASND
jgi:hypothetical protein